MKSFYKHSKLLSFLNTDLNKLIMLSKEIHSNVKTYFFTNSKPDIRKIYNYHFKLINILN